MRAFTAPSVVPAMARKLAFIVVLTVASARRRPGSRDVVVGCRTECIQRGCRDAVGGKGTLEAREIDGTREPSLGRQRSGYLERRQRAQRLQIGRVEVKAEIGFAAQQRQRTVSLDVYTVRRDRVVFQLRPAVGESASGRERRQFN